MYKLVHTHTKSEIAYALSYATHIIQVSPICHAYFESREDFTNHLILKKNKTRHKIKYFCLFENFQCFWIFFLFKSK